MLQRRQLIWLAILLLLAAAAVFTGVWFFSGSGSKTPSGVLTSFGNVGSTDYPFGAWTVSWTAPSDPGVGGALQYAVTITDQATGATAYTQSGIPDTSVNIAPQLTPSMAPVFNADTNYAISVIAYAGSISNASPPATATFTTPAALSNPALSYSDASSGTVSFTYSGVPAAYSEFSGDGDIAFHALVTLGSSAIIPVPLTYSATAATLVATISSVNQYITGGGSLAAEIQLWTPVQYQDYNDPGFSVQTAPQAPSNVATGYAFP